MYKQQQRRTAREVKAEMLRHAKDGIKPTRLMYATNTSCAAMNRYLEELEEKKMIERINTPRTKGLGKVRKLKDKRTRFTLQTTNYGLEVLRKYDDLNKVQL